MKENCEVLARARIEAKRKGLDESKVECPFIDVCKGTKCYMFQGGFPRENMEIAEDMKNYEIPSGKYRK